MIMVRSVSHVDARVEAFLKKFARDMRRLGERALSATKSSLVQLKHTTDYELKEEVERNWRELLSMEYQFHRLYHEVPPYAPFLYIHTYHSCFVPPARYG
jgi:hypothetical protein